MKAILFDLDGTLLNTLPEIAKSLNEALSILSLPKISLSKTREYVGDGARKLIERAVGQRGNVDRALELFKESYEKSELKETSLFEGEMEALFKLKENYRLAVLTNKPQQATERCISRFFPEGFFDFVGGDSGMFPLKPDPSFARFIALTLRVPLCDCVMVGDGEADVLTAKNAKLRCISALWGYRTREELSKVGAREFAASFSKLSEIL